ncbi:phosphotransferase [Microbacterium sp. 22242]|uniref:phosphotransferase n=1 Tax=Microbacterium sp. 22242 TaxID=3453896 RepID=UPI003F877145
MPQSDLPLSEPDEQEAPLPGGNAGGAVVRIGRTVRKSWTPATEHVVRFVTTLRERGVDAPTPLGRDGLGRQIIEYVPGDLAVALPRLTPSEFARAGGMVRRIHDAAASYVPAADATWDTPIAAPGAELICHNDLAPWNLLVGERWVFIDWDGAGPSTRLWDLAYAAQAFTLNDATVPPASAARDLAAFVDGYRADDTLRAALPAAMQERTTAMLDLLRTSHRDGVEPWGSMLVNGHGTHWANASAYVGAHQEVWARALRREQGAA